ncbi:MAG: ABC transporter ATP-binding protein [Lachnospiraceae bacterium]|nr:ABC transporter ATP-binding protein [Lachnospiraceae bacterium]
MIHLQQISKKYDEKWILKDINQYFPEGSATAIVGHNGCGKSTLLKILSGLVVPSKGRVQYDRPITFHYVPEKFPAIPLTAEQYLLHTGVMDGLPVSQARVRIRELAEDFYVTEHLQSDMTVLSKGTLQKIGVIQAILTVPDVLLLDEPLSGQDVDSQKVFVEKINDLRSRGITLLMSCHEPELVEAITEKSYTIAQGVLVPASVAKEDRYLVLLHWAGAAEEKQRAGERLKGISEDILPYGEGYQIRLTQQACDCRLEEILAQGWKLRSLQKIQTGEKVSL